MNIVQVIPLSRGINKDVLSYFTSTDVKSGDIVKVTLRNKPANALVISSRSVEESKLDVKGSSFAFKKIEAVTSQNLLSRPFMLAVKKTADYHTATLGSMLFSLLPKIVLEQATELITIPAPEKETTTESSRLHGTILQSDDDDRFSNYRSLVREEFARGRSVFLCMPTSGDIKRAERLLEKGIAEYSYIFHGQMKKKELVKKWNELAREPHPVFIIATGQFFCLPRHDIGTIIIERENSRNYKSQTRPYTDLRFFAEAFAKETRTRIVFGDTLLRTETVWRFRNDELLEIAPPTLRIPTNANQRIVDMRKIHKTLVKFNPISPDLAELIRISRERSERLVIFASRRGLAPLTVCADCGKVVSCNRCQAPVVLHTKNLSEHDAASFQDEIRFFMCHRCGEIRDAKEKCKVCTSWRLQTLGIGAELVAEEISAQFPNHSVLRLDADSVKTHKEATTVIKKFYDTPGGVLVCTEMALLYLDQKVENVAVASIDSMFGVPDFRIRERILSILIRLRTLAVKNFLIQTRNTEEPVFTFAEKGNLIDFYRQEIIDRETYDYPPFTVLIKISLSGEKTKVEEAMSRVGEFLKEYDVSLYPAFTPMARGLFTMHALIKIGRARWVEPSLYEKLRSLPLAFRIAVDPESIL